MKNIDDLKHDLRIEFEENKKQAEEFFKNHSDQNGVKLLDSLDKPIKYIE